MTDPHMRYGEMLDRLRCFRETSVLIAFAEPGIGDAIAAAHYGLEFDFASLPRLCQQYGVTFLSGAP